MSDGLKKFNLLLDELRKQWNAADAASDCDSLEQMRDWLEDVTEEVEELINGYASEED